VLEGRALEKRDYSGDSRTTMKKTLITAALAAVAASLTPASAFAHSAVARVNCNDGKPKLLAEYNYFPSPIYGPSYANMTVKVDDQVFDQTPTGGRNLQISAFTGSSTITIELTTILPDDVVHTVEFDTSWGAAHGTQVPNNETGTYSMGKRTLRCPKPPETTTTTTTTTTTSTTSTTNTTPTLPPVTTGTTTFVPIQPGTPTVTGADDNKKKKRACTSVKARSYRVRAGQRNTVTVTVKTTSKTRPTVRLKGAGVSTKKKVSSKGTVTFRVTPKRAGSIRVTASGCAKTASVRVSRAKSSRRSGTSPTFTG